MSENHTSNQPTLNLNLYINKNLKETLLIDCENSKPQIELTQDNCQYVQTVTLQKNQKNIINSQETSLNKQKDDNELKHVLISNQNYSSQNNYRNFKSKSEDECIFSLNSFILIFFNTVLSVGALIFYQNTLKYIINNYSLNDTLIIGFIASYSMVIFLRVIIHLIICFINSISSCRRVSFGISFFCPFLKYYLIRKKSNEFGFNKKTVLVTDIISSVFLLSTAIFSILCRKHILYCFRDSNICQSYGGLFFIAACLLIQVILQILGYYLYINLIKEKLHQQHQQKVHQSNDKNFQRQNKRILNNNDMSLQENRQLQNQQTNPRNSALSPIIELKPTTKNSQLY